MLRATGLRPSELAARAGLAPSTLTRFLNSPVKHTLSARTLSKLSEVSGVTNEKVVAIMPHPKGILLVGHLGIGEKVYGIDEQDRETVEAPPGVNYGMLAIKVVGDSMFPAFWDGDVLYYPSDGAFDRELCLYNECVVRVEGGDTYVKRIMPGSSADTYVLTSYNAPPLLDVRIEWAAPVQFQDKRRRRRTT